MYRMLHDVISVYLIMKELIVTGFEPFGGETINPSWEAVKLLPDIVNGYRLIKLELPTVYGKAAEKIFDAAKNTDLFGILSVGQAGGRRCVTPEMSAINLRYSRIPDNSGRMCFDEPVAEGGENSYFSTLPVRKIEAALKDKGIESAVSYSAGTFVCNDVMYSVLQHFRDTDVKCGFIHIPYIPEQGHLDQPSMPLETIIRALVTAISVITA